MMSAVRATPAGVLMGAMILCHAQAHAARCESLRSLELAQTTLTSVTRVAAGSFAPARTDAEPRGAAAWQSLGAFCRVQGVIAPSTDSHIEFEVWLPASDWNGRYQGTGNGGLAGSINYRDMATALRAGLATSSTDTGHRGEATDGTWALHHPQRIIDYAYRAIHLTAEDAKAIVRAYYGRGPSHAYFSSCSNGGREALLEAQRFPRDYDGIIAGAPAIAIARTLALFHSNQLALQGTGYIPATKYAALEAAVLAACDSRDGTKDGIVDDPRRCTFDPEIMRCAGPETERCLTAPQIAALERIYAGPHTRTGAQIYPGLFPGGESGPLGWGLWVSGPAPGKSLDAAFLTEGGPAAFFDEPGWSYASRAVDGDILHSRIDRLLDADEANLTAFRARGGKLILYHGWSDPALPPLETVRYYERVRAKMGSERTRGFVRLYMVPGMQHCGGGPGTDDFGTLPAGQANPHTSLSAALERWVEQGIAPGAIIARKRALEHGTARTVRTRPLCPYPDVARYRGSGSLAAATNFTCSAEPL